MSEKHPRKFLPETEADFEIAGRWREELLEGGRFSGVPQAPEWELGDEYRANPFGPPRIRQVFAVGTEHPEAVVYNCGSKLLGFTQREHIRDTYQWYYDKAGMEVFEAAPIVVIGSHMHRIIDEATGRSRRRLGMFDEEGPWPVISLSSLVFEKAPPAEAGRYHELLERNIPLSEIILGHEIVHALVQIDSTNEEYFKQHVGWEERTYDTEDGEHTIRGLGYLASGEPSMAMTDLGFTEPAEDISESGVFYRFVPRRLGPERQEYFDRYLAALQEFGREDPLPGSHVRVVELPGRVFLREQD